jgi:hypothetical protein
MHPRMSVRPRIQSWASLSHRYRATATRVSSSRVYRAAADRVSVSYRAAADRVSVSYRVAADRVSTSYRATADRVSSSPAYRVAADRVSVSYRVAAGRVSASLVYRAATGTARKYSRVSVIAASVAAVGVLGAAGFAVGAAPWGQAVGTMADTVQGHASPASGQPGTSLFEAITGGKPLAGGPLDTVHFGAALGDTKAAAAAAQHQAAVAAAQRAQAAKQAAAKAQAAKAKAHEAPARPYTIYDSVKPERLPGGKAAAVYANGNYAASSSQMRGRNSVLWIDTNGSDPAADVLDVEPGDATPYGAALWVQHRLSAQPDSVAIVYTMRSEWQEVKDNVAHLPGWMQSKVRYWIADPTGVPHVVPGSSATQWYWGNSYDMTTATPGFAR